jgi:hypothetical protein
MHMIAAVPVKNEPSSEVRQHGCWSLKHFVDEERN